MIQNPQQAAEAQRSLRDAEHRFRSTADPIARLPLAREILALRTALVDYGAGEQTRTLRARPEPGS